MGRMGVASFLLLGCFFLGGCTSFLAAQGDPDLEVLYPGAGRRRIEREMGKPKSVQHLGDGRYVALYVIKLGAPKNKAGKRDSIKNVGKGMGATIASGAFSRVVNTLASGGGWSSGVTGNATAAAAIGLTVWAAGELAGTVRELTRLSRRRKHQLEIVFDEHNELLSHQLIPLNGRKSAETGDAPSESELHRRWRSTYSVRAE